MIIRNPDSISLKDSNLDPQTEIPFVSVRIRDVYPGSKIFLSRIPGEKDSGYRIRNRIKEF
jgi:hypothetical protein